LVWGRVMVIYLPLGLVSRLGCPPAGIFSSSFSDSVRSTSCPESSLRRAMSWPCRPRYVTLWSGAACPALGSASMSFLMWRLSYSLFLSARGLSILSGGGFLDSCRCRLAHRGLLDVPISRRRRFSSWPAGPAVGLAGRSLRPAFSCSRLIWSVYAARRLVLGGIP